MILFQRSPKQAVFWWRPQVPSARQDTCHPHGGLGLRSFICSKKQACRGSMNGKAQTRTIHNLLQVQLGEKVLDEWLPNVMRSESVRHNETQLAARMENR